MLSPSAAILGIAVMMNPQSHPTVLARNNLPASGFVVLASGVSAAPGIGTIMQVDPPSSATASGVGFLQIMKVDPPAGPSASGVQVVPIMRVDPPSAGVGGSISAVELPSVKVNQPLTPAVSLPAWEGLPN
jgi:hypothetical protein